MTAQTVPEPTGWATARQAELVGRGGGASAWIVALGEELYVRSVSGDRVLGGRAELHVDGAAHPVTLAEVAPEVHGLLDDAYRAKYGRCTPEKVSAVVSDVAAATTFRLRPRRLSWSDRALLVVDGLRDRWALRRAVRDAEVPCPTC